MNLWVEIKVEPSVLFLLLLMVNFQMEHSYSFGQNPKLKKKERTYLQIGDAV